MCENRLSIHEGCWTEGGQMLVLHEWNPSTAFNIRVRFSTNMILKNRVSRILCWILCYLNDAPHSIPWGTALCGAHPPLVKSCTIIWCIIQREHNVENRCDLLAFMCFQRLLNLYAIHTQNFYHAFYKDILHFLNLDTALQNKINNWKKFADFHLVPQGTVYIIKWGFCKPSIC